MRKSTAPLLAIAMLLASLVASPAHGSPKSKTVHITLLQLNDVYQISPVDQGKRGGLARVATLLNQVRKTSPHTLFVLAGDTLSPSVASRLFKGAQMVALWNALGLDLATFGNHEFDFGLDVLRARVHESRFRWLVANVEYRHDHAHLVRPYEIRVLGGVKVGVIGLVTPETAQSSKPGERVAFLDPIATARREIPCMRREGAQVIVALTHLSLSDDKALAAAVPDIDVVCGGHEHILLQSVVGHTIIFKVTSDARQLGRIDLFYDVTRHHLASLDWSFIEVDDKVPADPRVSAIVKRYENKLDAELDKPVGRTSVDLDARRETNRTAESNLGNFITDAYRAHTAADVALTNGGSIRSDSIHSIGSLTMKDIVTFLPFENPIVKVEVTGKTLREALEHGVASLGQDNGAFPQVSGMRFSYDGRKPVGERVSGITVGGRPLVENRRYTLATNSYVLGGGDGYRMFRNARELINLESAQIDAAVVAAFVRAAGEISPRVEGRITRIDPSAP